MQQLKTYFLSRTFPLWSMGWSFQRKAPCSRAAVLRGRACQHLPSGSVQDKALGYCQCSNSPLFVFSFHSYWWCCPVGAAGKATESGAFWKAFWMLAYADQARFKMDPNYSSNWTSRQASKCKYFPGTFFWEKRECTAENQACMSSL